MNAALELKLVKQMDNDRWTPSDDAIKLKFTTRQHFDMLDFIDDNAFDYSEATRRQISALEQLAVGKGWTP